MNVPLPHCSADTHSVRPFAPSLEGHRLRLSAALVGLDFVAILAGFLLVGGVYLGQFPSDLATRMAVLISPLFVLFGAHVGTYRSEVILSIRKASYVCCYALALAALFMLFITFYAKITENFSRVVLTFGCVLSIMLILAGRWLVKRWVTATVGPSLQNTLIIHAGGPAVHMDRAFHIDAREHGLSPDPNDPQSLDRLGWYMQNMDRVIVSCPGEDRDEWAPLLRAAGITGEFVSGALRKLGALKIQNEPTFSSVVVSVRPLGLEARFAKRVMDLALSTLGLLILSPLMMVVAVLIRAEDGGPVLFKQRRMGRGNRFFWIYKFRSMRVELEDADGIRSAGRQDDRTTRIGAFMRRTSIDELPQLFNVWRGDMSLVGPRPHALGSQAGTRLFWEIDGRYWNRHALKPGLTGLAQVKGYRGATECERDLIDRLQADLEYVAAWSVWLDLKILMKTLRVLVHDNAY